MSDTSDPAAGGPASSAEPALDYKAELERTQQQLLVFAREMRNIYMRTRRQSQEQKQLMEELNETYLSTVQTLAFVVEAKDEYTAYHLERCKEYATALAEKIDPSLATPEVQYGYLLHDVGKIGVPEAILSKPGPLTAEEMRVMQTHPLIGVQIVSHMRSLDERALQVIRNHHERFDGKGYPDALEAEDIPLAARVFTVVDSFDAMTTDRPYRRALSFDQALERLRSGAGSQFDPMVVDAFIALMEQYPHRAEVG